MITITNGTEPLTLDEVKQYLRIDFDDDDDLITSLMLAARQTTENKCGQHLVSRLFTISLDELEKQSTFDLSYVTDIDGYYDNGVNLNLDLTVKIKTHSVDITINEDLPQTTSPTLVGTLHYPQADDLKIVMLILIAHFYEHRQAVSMGSVAPLPLSVDYLLGPHRNTKAG